MYGSKMLIEYSFKSLIKVCHQLPKRGEIESTSRPLINFGVLNDNLIK
jgi:hypothetical protein